jgi:type VI secretion system protein ImpH
MASARRPSSDHLSFLRGSKERARWFSIFALLRQAEARAPGLPPIGRSRLPRDNVVDLAHSMTLDFPGATVEAMELGATGRVRVRTCFLGLTGPMGALPLHLSELAHYESRYAKSQPIGRFFDLLTDRMLQFFYRAWADTQPAVGLDRSGEDRFSFYVASLAGIREDPRRYFPAASRLGFANLFVSRRSPAALIDAVSHLLGMRVQIEEFVGRWRDVASHDRTRIGGNCNELGRSAMLGHRVAVADDTYRVKLRAADMAEYRRHLPNTKRFFAVQDVLDTLAPVHLEWQLQLEVGEDAIEPARLDGNASLGWAAWVAPRGLARTRGDARLGRRSRPAGCPS